MLLVFAFVLIKASQSGLWPLWLPDWIETGYSMPPGGRGCSPTGPVMFMVIHTLPIVERHLTVGVVESQFFVGFHNFSCGWQAIHVPAGRDAF